MPPQDTTVQQRIRQAAREYRIRQSARSFQTQQPAPFLPPALPSAAPLAPRYDPRVGAYSDAPPFTTAGLGQQFSYGVGAPPFRSMSGLASFFPPESGVGRAGLKAQEIADTLAAESASYRQPDAGAARRFAEGFVGAGQEMPTLIAELGLTGGGVTAVGRLGAAQVGRALASRGVRPAVRQVLGKTLHGGATFGAHGLLTAPLEEKLERAGQGAAFGFVLGPTAALPKRFAIPAAGGTITAAGLAAGQTLEEALPFGLSVMALEAAGALGPRIEPQFRARVQEIRTQRLLKKADLPRPVTEPLPESAGRAEIAAKQAELDAISARAAAREVEPVPKAPPKQTDFLKIDLNEVRDVSKGDVTYSGVQEKPFTDMRGQLRSVPDIELFTSKQTGSTFAVGRGEVFQDKYFRHLEKFNKPLPTTGEQAGPKLPNEFSFVARQQVGAVERAVRVRDKAQRTRIERELEQIKKFPQEAVEAGRALRDVEGLDWIVREIDAKGRINIQNILSEHRYQFSGNEALRRFMMPLGASQKARRQQIIQNITRKNTARMETERIEVNKYRNVREAAAREKERLGKVITPANIKTAWLWAASDPRSPAFREIESKLPKKVAEGIIDAARRVPGAHPSGIVFTEEYRRKFIKQLTPTEYDFFGPITRQIRNSVRKGQGHRVEGNVDPDILIKRFMEKGMDLPAPVSKSIDAKTYKRLYNNALKAESWLRDHTLNEWLRRGHITQEAYKRLSASEDAYNFYSPTITISKGYRRGMFGEAAARDPHRRFLKKQEGSTAYEETDAMTLAHAQLADGYTGMFRNRVLQKLYASAETLPKAEAMPRVGEGPIAYRLERGQRVPEGYTEMFVRLPEEARFALEDKAGGTIFQAPSYGPQAIHTAMQILSLSQAIKWQATGPGNPFWAIWNLAKDFVYIYSTGQEAGFSTNLLAFPFQYGNNIRRVFGDVIKNRGIMLEMAEQGALQQFILAEQSRLTSGNRFRGADTGPLGKLRGAIATLENVSGWAGTKAEQLGRAAIYDRTMQTGKARLDALRKQGELSVDEFDLQMGLLREQAASNSRSKVGIAFDEIGAVTYAINDILPYFSAAIAATRGMWRAFKRNKRDFLARQAQFIVALGSTYIFSRQAADHFFDGAGTATMDGMSREKKENNFLMPTPWLSFKDGDGDRRYTAVAFPLDSLQRYTWSVWRKLIDKYYFGDEWNKQDKQEFVTALHEIATIVPGQDLPPIYSALMTYFHAIDPRTGRKIANTSIMPQDRFDERTPPIWKLLAQSQVGGALNLSPDQLKAASEKIVIRQNPYAWVGGNALARLMREVPEEQRDRMFYDFITEEIPPSMRQYLAFTTKTPHHLDEAYEDAELQAGSARKLVRDELDKQVGNFLGASEDKRPEDALGYIKNALDFVAGRPYILELAQINPDQARDELSKHRDYMLSSLLLDGQPNRAIFRRLSYLGPIERAKLYLDTIKSKGKREREIMEEQLVLMAAVPGSGFASENFVRALVFFATQNSGKEEK